MQLYDHQLQTLEALRGAFRSGNRSVMLYAPTGMGKTEIAIALMVAAAEKGNRSAIVLDRVALCDQTSKRLDKYEINHSVMQAGHWRNNQSSKIQVCSAQTLEAIGSFPDISMLIVDEAHAQRKGTKEFIANNPHIKVIGLSASPFTKGLAQSYQLVVSAATNKWLVDNGFLTSLRIFVAKEIDMDGAKKVAGEWSSKEATERGKKITGDVVAEWVKTTHAIFGKARKTLVFCAGVAHGEDLARRFGEAGYNFVSISYKDDDELKREIIEDFSKPDTQIDGLIATDILTKGFDVPDVMIGVSARPFSKSFSSHVQQMGRVMRLYDGKEFGVWIDHSGNYLRFQNDWDDLYNVGVHELKDGVEKPKKELSKAEKEKATCPKCKHVMSSDTCPYCGFVRIRANDVTEVAGELTELGQNHKSEKHTSEYKEMFYQELIGYAKEHGFKDGWSFHKYKEKFGVNPAWKKVAKEPSIEVVRYAQSRNIAYAKRRSSHAV